MKRKQKIPQEKYRVFCADGFTLVETVVYVLIVSLIVLLVSSFFFYFNYANSQTQGDRDALENARRALEEITYEVRGANSIYTPTTSANQLSLQTFRYLPAGETTTYIDFFLCGSRVCLKKESQNPIYLTSDTVQVNNLTFTQATNNGFSSIQIAMTVAYKNPTNNLSQSVSLTSTASLRSY